MHHSITIILLSSSILFAQQSLGEKFTLESPTSVSSILDAPETYVNKQVQITGTIIDVCKMRGCWIEVSSDLEYETIQVKVDDGVIVFPVTAKGKKVVAEGTLEKLVLSDEQALKMKKHEAEEIGEKFDESSYKITESDKTIYRLRGLGAVIDK